MRISTLVVVCTTVVEACASQMPIRNSKRLLLAADIQDDTWEFNLGLADARESSNSTSHLVFNTVSALLQQLPNTRYRNGHTLVPGVVPQGTLLYHGDTKPEVPTTPEWTATDPEHSYLFCRSDENVPGCWQLTLITTRPLKILYFDGNSAGKMKGGNMDSQDILLWGEVKPKRTWEELRRIAELCDWGREFGLDGFVRMEMDFEVMLCDFTAGVEQVSFDNLVTRLPTPTNSSVIQMENRLPALWVSALESGAWHNQYPGEARIHLDLSRLVSFYDTSLVPSLVPLRYGKHRLVHRLEAISPADSSAIQNRLREVLSDKAENGSGIDWRVLLRVIIQRYADRLELMQYFLHNTLDGVSSIPLDQASNAQFELREILNPHLLLSAVPPPDSSDKANISWATPVFKHCATTHTAHFTSNRAFAFRLTSSERLILDAVRGTTREICRVIVGMWAEGVMNGIDPMLQYTPSTPQNADEIGDMVAKWRNEINLLMGWLDWSVWVKCKPACSFEEMCYLPTWPFLRPSNPPHRHVPAQGGMEQDDESEWLDPKPKCYRRVKPYNL